jgi:hypothetical protein
VNPGGSKVSLGGLWTLTVEAWRPKIELWRVYRPVVADSHHFELNRRWIRIRIKVKSWIRIHIKVMRIRSPAVLKISEANEIFISKQNFPTPVDM